MTAREIKTTLALDGEKQFKAGMSEAYNAMKVLGSELKLNTAQFGDNAKSMDGLTQRGSILRKEIEQQKVIVEALRKAVKDSADAYGETDKKTDAYRVKLNNAEAALARMGKELDANEQAVEDLGKETEDAEKKTSKWGDTLKKVGDTLGKGFVAAAKSAAVAVGTVAVAAGTMAVKAGKEVVMAFGELEQNLGGSEAVFGEYAAAIQKSGEEAYKNLGVSQSQYLATANKMGALFQGSGISQQKSLDMTTQAMQRAADMASVMGIDMSMAMESVAGAAKGNFTMMDNLGVSMNATSIEAYALAQGLDFTFATATQAEKAELAMKMFLENTTQYAGNFARESTETITGSLGMLKASAESFVAGLGNTNADMTALTNGVVTSFQAVVANIVPIVENLIAALPPAVSTIVTQLGSMIPMFIEVAARLFTETLNSVVGLLPTLVPVAVDAVVMFAGALVDNMPEILDAAIALFEGLLDGLLESIPLLIPVAIEAVLTLSGKLIDMLPEIIDAGIKILLALIKGIVDKIPELARMVPKLIVTIVQTLAEKLPEIIKAGAEILGSFIKGIIEAIPELVKALPQIISAIVGGLMAGLGAIGEVGVNMVKGLWEGIKSSTQWLWDKLTGWIEDALGWLGNLLGIKSPSRVMANMIGKPMVQGLAKGILDNAGMVDAAMSNLVPSAVHSNVMMDVTRSFSDVVNSRPADERTSLIDAIREAMGDQIIVLNDREFGRAVRRAYA